MVKRSPFFSLALAVAGASVVACSSGGGTAIKAPAPPVAPVSPPKDDGKPAKGVGGGGGHAAALEQLKSAPVGPRTDKQNSLRIQLPDANHWTRVKFWGVPSLVGFRYGKEHHAIVAAFITHVDDNLATGACQKSFEDMALPYIGSFEVEVEYEPPHAVVWNGKIADVASVFARTATLAARDSYAAAFGAFPAWKGACLIVGVAVPAGENEQRARDVRDRFVRDVLPRIDVTTAEEPKERY